MIRSDRRTKRGIAVVVKSARSGGIERLIDRAISLSSCDVRWTICEVPNIAEKGRLAYLLAAIRCFFVAHFTLPDVIMADRVHSGLAAGVIHRTFRRHVRSVLWVHGSELLSDSHSRTKRFALQSAHVIALTRWTSDLVSRHARPKSLSIVNPGVDYDYWAQRDERWVHSLMERVAPANESIVLSVGRIDLNARHKGIHRVNAAVERLRAEGVPVVHLIVGDGNDVAWLESVLDANNSRMFTTWIRGATDAELRACYHTSNVLALPSAPPSEGEGSRQTAEGFGLVFLEAASAGCPSIVTNHGGALEAVDLGRSGWACDGSTKSISAAIRHALDSPLPRDSVAEWGMVNDWSQRSAQLRAAILGHSDT